MPLKVLFGRINVGPLFICLISNLIDLTLNGSRSLLDIFLRSAAPGQQRSTQDQQHTKTLFHKW
jgi:hypothetical protein